MSIPGSETSKVETGSDVSDGGHMTSEDDLSEEESERLCLFAGLGLTSTEFAGLVDIVAEINAMRYMLRVASSRLII